MRVRVISKSPLFRWLIDFCPLGQKRMGVIVGVATPTYITGGAMPIGSALVNVFFFSVHFSFCVVIKKKSEQRKINIFKHAAYSKYYALHLMNDIFLI